MKKFVLLVLLFLTISIFNIYASSKVDVIYLKNGDILKGQIVVDVYNDYLQIEMKDGTIKKVMYKDIEKREYKNSIENNDSNNESTDSNDISDFLRPNHISLGFSTFQLDYKETWVPPEKSNENGLIPGLFVSTTTNDKYPFRIKCELGLSYANENYDGSVSRYDSVKNVNVTSPLSSTTKSTFLNFNLLAEYEFALSDGFFLMPYIGYNYRSWSRKIQGSGGYDELYYWNNIPIGTALNYNINSDFSFGINASLNYMAKGGIDIDFTRANNGQTTPIISLTLGNVLAWKLSFPMKYTISEKTSLIFEPYYEYYGFNKSNTYTEYYYGDDGRYYRIDMWEPSSNTNIYGLRFELMLHF